MPKNDIIYKNMAYINIKITSDFITLGQFVKIVDLVSTGGEAKFFILNTNIYINGELEKRRGRKIYVDDVIKINNKEYKIC